MKPKYTEFVETILDSIADGVFTIDRKNVITSFNKAAERITGYTKEEAVGRFCYDIFRANICQGACALEEALHTERDVVAGTFRFWACRVSATLRAWKQRRCWRRLPS